LNLREKADSVKEAEAIDLLNVQFYERGAIRQRDGYQDLTQASLTNRVDSLSPYYNVSGAKHLIAGCGGRLETLDALGNIIASRTGLSGGPYSFARFGDPTHEYLYAANGIDTLQRWDGASWASGDVLAMVNGVPGVAMPRAGSICVTASVAGSSSGTNASNRLIATAFGTLTTAGPGGAVSNPSRVYFSNPGRPDLWETDGLAITPIPTEGPLLRGRNYVDLTPGDGEQILAAVTWRELVFIWKETKFFVLWGEGQGADATPTFQVREVVNNIGLASRHAIAIGRDGVYFANRRGVYRTSGGDPQLISDVITPLWTQDPDIYFQSSPINMAQVGLIRALWHNERFYLAVPTGASSYCDRVLVYDTQHQSWTLYDMPASALASFRSGDAPALHLGYSTGPNRVGRSVIGLPTDRGLPMTSRWRSGWTDYGGQQTTVRETKLWGSGAITVGFSVDFDRIVRASRNALLSARQNWPTAGAGTWNDWLALGDGLWPGEGQTSDALVRYASRGTVFSTQFSSSPSAPTWAVHRVARHLREIREPSIR
jgi:hypothetical protein